MIRNIFKGVLFISVLIIIEAAGYGDIIRLKNGVILTGDIIAETGAEFVIKTEKYGEARVQKFSISSIEYGSQQSLNNTAVISNEAENTNSQNVTVSTNVLKKNKTPSDRANRPLFGLNAGFMPMWSGLSLEVPSSYLPPGVTEKIYEDFEVRNYMQIGLFLDLIYVRLDLSYGFSLGKLNGVTLRDEMTSSSATIVMTNYGLFINSVSSLNIAMIFKVPVNISEGSTVWPAVGFECTIPLTYEINDTNVITNSYYDLTDIWLKAGFGVNIKISEQVYFVPSVFVSINLTPNIYKDTDNDPISGPLSFSDLKYASYAWRLDFNIGIAFGL